MGPLPEGDRSGGVAVFTLRLGYKLMALGYDVTIFSKNSKPYINSGNILNIRNLKKSIKHNRPDIIISSLWYSLFILNVKSVVKVHLLHGFTNLKSYGLLKFILMIIFDKIVRSKFDYVLANSFFTKSINEEMFNISVDNTFRIGLPEKEIIDLSVKIPKDGVLYLGRLVKAKNVDKVIRAFNHIEFDDEKLTIVGYGPQEEYLKQIASPNNIFVGAVPNGKVVDFYRSAKVFVSLNPSEPYGITYLEALIADDFVIAPNTGGQVELLKEFGDRVILVNIQNISEIESAIKVGLRKTLTPFNEAYDLEKFTYSRTVNDILKVTYDS